jgi:capsular polysaccharide export protein
VPRVRRDTLARAASLRAAIVAAGLSKYNVGGQVWRRPSTARRVILVPGQVERDESIRLGAPDIKCNVDLLRAVRAARPDAYLVYKPHPDVVSGLRRAGARESRASEWCDEIVDDADIGEMLNQVDEVHTMTSLTGFEALLRQRHVVTYGQPFYAGWGLTEDKLPTPRRTRKLTLDELVAGALLLYPRYLSRATGKLVAAEDALAELLAWRGRRGRGPSIKSVVRAPMRQLLRWAGDR